MLCFHYLLPSINKFGLKVLRNFYVLTKKCLIQITFMANVLKSDFIDPTFPSWLYILSVASTFF